MIQWGKILNPVPGVKISSTPTPRARHITEAGRGRLRSTGCQATSERRIRSNSSGWINNLFLTMLVFFSLHWLVCDVEFGCCLGFFFLFFSFPALVIMKPTCGNFFFISCRANYTISHVFITYPEADYSSWPPFIYFHSAFASSLTYWTNLWYLIIFLLKVNKQGMQIALHLWKIIYIRGNVSKRFKILCMNFVALLWW